MHDKRVEYLPAYVGREVAPTICKYITEDTEKMRENERERDREREREREREIERETERERGRESERDAHVCMST